MKKLGISDIDNNLESIFKSNLGNRNANLFNMLKLVDNIDENMVLAIDGKWGTGKTVFVKQFEYLLNNYRNIENEIISELFRKKICNMK